MHGNNPVDSCCREKDKKMNSIRKTVILISLVLICLTGSAPAGVSNEQLFSLFSQANEAFRQANSTANNSEQQTLYEKSILLYEKIINEGRIRNSKLYYNLANACLLKGDIGKAVLNYRRAENLDRTDVNIRKNLAFALAGRLDKVEPKTEKRILRTLFFWHYDLPIKTRFALACICFALLCIGLTVMIWFGRTASMTVMSVVCCILTVCFLISVIFESYTQAENVRGVITAAEIIAHQGDGQNYPPSFKDPLHTGTDFELIEHRTGWFHIRLVNDTDGWIPDSSAELL
jgi:lipopolysaccharide export LptBFGC system permease protein LptF